MRLAGIVLSLLMGILSVGCSGCFGLKDLSPWASLGDPVNGPFRVDLLTRYLAVFMGANQTLQWEPGKVPSPMMVISGMSWTMCER